MLASPHSTFFFFSLQIDLSHTGSIFTVFSTGLILLAWNKGDKYHRAVDQD